ncbi:phage tail assembly protein [Kluyvera intermedia]|uniref:phage tail assembly protein n=1 Tax=Kluyvera intermedia TaxID=61648 RepID=UPI003523EC9B
MNYPANTTVITLSRPYTIDGKEVTEINMREPNVRDKLQYEKSTGGTMERESVMIAGLCGLNQADLLLLPAYDYDQLVVAFNGFLLPPADRQKSDSSTISQASPGGAV